MDDGNDPQNQIFNTLDLKETSDLLQIWKAKDRSSWSDEAFQAIEKILERRLGTVPTQGVNEVQEVQEVQEVPEIPEEDKNGKWLEWISTIAEALSYITLVFFIVAGIAPYIGTRVDWVIVAISVGSAILTGLFLFVILQFISKVTPVLLDIRDYTGCLMDEKDKVK